VRFELELRGELPLGRHIQLVNRLYTALDFEGRAIKGDEAAALDAEIADPETSSGDEAANAAAAADAAVAATGNTLFAAQRTRTGILIAGASAEQQERIMSNTTGLQAVFLSKVTASNGLPVATTAALRFRKSVWFFECGEDTQRGLIGHPLIDWKRVDRVFLSSISTDAVLGLPGMLCTVSASKLKGHEAADFPVHVYGPRGLVQFVK
jgi:hypothetical protein